MLTALAISNYRSLRDLVIPLQRLNVVTGPNGSGKSSLYRALRLLADTAQGRVVSSIAREGGLQSTLWAGPESISPSMRRGDHPIQGTRRTQPVNLRLGFAGDEYGYLIDLGLPTPASSAFSLDPQIKRECIWHGPILRPSTMLVDRHGPLVRILTEDGKSDLVTDRLSAFDSMMTNVSDPRNAPEMLTLRESIRDWRFYDHFRTDADAPVRSPKSALGHRYSITMGRISLRQSRPSAKSGPTTCSTRRSKTLFRSVENMEGRFALTMVQHGLLRPLGTAELSDGTLRYLLWIAALLTPRPPALMVLNEPETSLHPDLLAALARLIARAAERTQVVVVTHANPVVSALAEQPNCHSIMLEKRFGETEIAGTKGLGAPAWHWPSR
jgi:predicted ATPase